MHVFGIAQMLEHVHLAVEHLQHEIVERLQPAARTRVRGVARKGLQLGVDPADDALDPARDHGMCVGDQHRRREGLVEDDRLVAHLQDARHLQAVEAGLRRPADVEGGARMRNLDLLFHMHRRRRIDHRLQVAHEPAAARPFRHVDLAAVDGGRRQCQPHHLLVRAFGHVDRRRQGGGARHVERRAVLEDAAGASQRELVLFGQIAVDLELREAPRIGADLAHPVLHHALEIAVVLLQVVLPEEQALRPCYLAVPRHEISPLPDNRDGQDTARPQSLGW